MKQDKHEYKGGEKKTPQQEALTELVREAQEMGAYDMIEGTGIEHGTSLSVPDSKEAAIQRLADEYIRAWDADETLPDWAIERLWLLARIAIEQGVLMVTARDRQWNDAITKEDRWASERAREQGVVKRPLTISIPVPIPWDAVCPGEEKK